MPFNLVQIAEDLDAVAREYEECQDPSWTRFICHEVARLQCRRNDEAGTLPVIRYLKALGMPLDGGGFEYWQGFSGDRVPQPLRHYLRHAWLVFARDLALEGFQP